MLDLKVLGDAIVVVLVGAKGTMDFFGGKKRDRRHGEALDSRFATLDLSLERRFNQVNSGVAEVRGFCVGPDGQNGMRKDLTDIKERVAGLEARERDRLHSAYDRRTS